jgi:hypothetical protein
MLPVPRFHWPKGSAASNLGIRLDSSIVDAEAGRVSGRVIFMNNDNIRVKRVTVSLHGIQQVEYVGKPSGHHGTDILRWYTNTMTSDRVRSKDVLFAQCKDLICTSDSTGTRASCLLTSGNFVWPFEFDLGACPLESVYGLGDNYVKYDLRVTVVTAGRFVKNIRAIKEFRVVRTPCLREINDTEPDQVRCSKLLSNVLADDLQDVYGMWPGKLDYHITTSPQYHHWGLPVTTTFRLQPLAEGVEIESVKVRLLESYRLRASSKHRDLFHRREMPISIVEASEQDNAVLHLQSSSGIWNDEWEVALPLPTSSRACRQSLHQGRITIAHKLLVDLHARDKDGTVYKVSDRH